MCKYAREIEYSFVTKIYCMIFVRPNATDKTRRIQDRNDSFSDKMSDCASSRVDLARTKYVPRVNVAGPGLLTAQILHVGDSVNLPTMLFIIHDIWLNMLPLYYRYFK